mmetsp:Transcript_1681/g.4412  ORF Transcript_1681/g.4412 Transcript_1681/m.4412 type:complete len:267 (-) Transcript_1681:4288-5088(-)
MPIQTTNVGWEKGRSDTRRDGRRVKGGSAATSRVRSANPNDNANANVNPGANANGNIRTSMRASTSNHRRNGIGAASNHRLPVKAVTVAGSQRPLQKSKPASTPTSKPSWTSETELASCLDQLVLDSTHPRPRPSPRSNGSNNASARLHPRPSRSAPAQSPNPNRRTSPTVSPGGTLARKHTHTHTHSNIASVAMNVSLNVDKGRLNTMERIIARAKTAYVPRIAGLQRLCVERVMGSFVSILIDPTVRKLTSQAQSNPAIPGCCR